MARVCLQRPEGKGIRWASCPCGHARGKPGDYQNRNQQRRSITLLKEGSGRGALADRLVHLASETSRKKSYFVNQALKEYFMALDDYEIALKRRGGAATPIDRAMKELGL